MRRKSKAPHIARKIPIRTVVVVSDTHCGCRLGIMGRDPVKVDDGGLYHPSKYQIMLVDRWDEFWGDHVTEWCGADPFCVVVNGDVIDGVHHGATSQISQNLEDQATIALRLFKPIVDRCEGRFYMIRGTEAHVGKSAAMEERIAKDLRAVKNPDGQHSSWDLWMRLGDSLLHFLHHIGTTGSAAYETTAICRELVAEFNEAARWGAEPPDCIVRSHAHRAVKIDIPTGRGPGLGIVTPAWQLKTPFAWRCAGMRLAPPHVGGVVIRRGDRALYAAPRTWSFARSETVTP